MSDETIVIERLFEADTETLYEAWTDPTIMAKWFFVESKWTAEVENDLRVGGHYRLSMILDDHTRHTMHGEYLELDLHRRISFTWSSHVVENSRVTIELEPQGDRTLLRLIHELVPPPTRAQHSHGWNGCLDSLARVLGP